jgi:hypothetical protein
MRFVKSFIAGFLSTLVFHQGLLALLHGAGLTPRKAWVMTPTPPLGVPAVLSLAFWGGIWGILLWEIVKARRGAGLWITALVFGAVAPTLVALLVVMPLKGMGMGGGWKPDLVVGALLLNGAWGAGVVAFMRFFGARA